MFDYLVYFACADLHQGLRGRFIQTVEIHNQLLFWATQLAVGPLPLNNQNEPTDLTLPGHKTVPLFTQDSTATISDRGLEGDFTGIHMAKLAPDFITQTWPGSSGLSNLVVSGKCVGKSFLYPDHFLINLHTTSKVLLQLVGRQLVHGKLALTRLLSQLLFAFVEFDNTSLLAEEKTLTSLAIVMKDPNHGFQLLVESMNGTSKNRPFRSPDISTGQLLQRI